jgi:hypothetical protein
VKPSPVLSLLLLALLAASACRREDVAAPSRTTPPPAPAAPLLAYDPVPIGAPLGEDDRPLVTHLQVVDLDQDGLVDVIYGEARHNTVRWVRQAPRGVFTETVIGEDVPGPAHVWAADLHARGRLDVLVASLGQILPSNDLIGAVIVLENEDNRRFAKRTIVDRIARVSDVRAANLSGHADGRLDLVVGQFGYAQGEVRWMRNLGDGRFESQVVNSLSGTIHTPVADFDGDGRIDFAALISQEWEEVHLFRNTGGAFVDQLVWGSTNEDYGSSGLEVADVNRDGRPDLIYTNGDGFDYSVRGPRPWHGLQWLENRGGGHFAFRRVGGLPGAYSPQAADLDGDGDIDLLAVSAFADWSDPDAVSMMAWLNDGRQNFTPVVLARRPTHLVTAGVGDLDGNGVPAIVTGGFHVYPPYEHRSNLLLWRRR